ncbi:MAG TPA: menaquinone biosynthesis protein [Acidobacteriota bacterium]|nr:menaquinone biosynthesis protein [Acidobacteriota bacterium]
MRIATIRFINALPLVYGLQKSSNHELFFETPSSCYKKLVDGLVDVALVPVLATQMHPTLLAVKGLGIASTKKTESVILFASKPLDRVKTILTDPASLTSVSLLKIILKKKYGNEPAYKQGPVDELHDALRTYDAVLVIGDQAILAEKTDYDHYDLASEWYSMTQLPFLFAVWASLKPLSPEKQAVLHESCVEGLAHIDEVYERALEMIPVDRKFVARYYKDDLHYQLTKNDYEGLLQYLTLLAEFKIINGIRKKVWM